MLEFRRANESELLDSIIKQAQGDDWLEKEVRNPETGNMVKVKSLPPKEQKKYRPKNESPGEPFSSKKIPLDHLRNVQVSAGDSGHIFSVDFKGKKPSDFNFNEKKDHKDISLKGKANISYDKKHDKWLTMDEDSVYKHLEKAVGDGHVDVTHYDGDKIYETGQQKPTLTDAINKEKEQKRKEGPGEPGK